MTGVTRLCTTSKSCMTFSCLICTIAAMFVITGSDLLLLLRVVALAYVAGSAFFLRRGKTLINDTGEPESCII